MLTENKNEVPGATEKKKQYSPIVSRFAGREIVFRLLHSLNAPLSITFTLSGIFISSSPLYQKQFSGIVSKSFGSTTFFRSGHALSASYSIFFTLFGSMSSVSPLSWKQYSPIVSMLSGSVMYLSLLHC